MRRRRVAALWLGAYIVLAVAPLALSLLQLDPGRGFWVNFSVSLGFVGLAILGLQFVLAARSVRITQPFGIDAVLQFHRQITALAVICVFAHPIILFLWDSRFLSLLQVWSAPWRARFAVLSVFLLVVLVVTAVWRRRLRLSYDAWQLLHALVAVAVVLTALLHVLLIGYYVDQPWERGLWIVYSGVFIFIGVWVRMVKPVRRWRQRWKVVNIRHELGESTTVTIAPVDPSSYGPDGFRFEPGQFAWIHTGHSPFAMTYHPFSFSSSATRPDQVSFTIKAAGEFTREVSDLKIGHTVYVDGPYGHFRLGDPQAAGHVFIAGGIGVTPMLSMIKTLADSEDPRPCWMLLGNRDQSSITCGQELSDLQTRLQLTYVDVLSSPSPGWSGEVGFINAALLDRVLPETRANLRYFLCGSEAMMDAVELDLGRLGIPEDRVTSERFAMV
jgi:predicted ferric reductase